MRGGAATRDIASNSKYLRSMTSQFMGRYGATIERNQWNCNEFRFDWRLSYVTAIIACYWKTQVLSFEVWANVLRTCWDIVKLSVPPIWIYITSDVQLSPPSFGIFKSVCWYGKFVFILVLSIRSVRQKKRCAMLCTTDSLKRSSRAWTIFNLRDPFTYYDWE